jgi:hypothetical protein
VNLIIILQLVPTMEMRAASPKSQVGPRDVESRQREYLAFLP